MDEVGYDGRGGRDRTGMDCRIRICMGWSFPELG
jgi:hypothetical protein